MRISDWSSDVCSSDLNQPVTFTECVGTYTGERTGRFHLWYNKGMSNALRHVGRGGQHPEDPQWYQRVVTKEMMEGMRRARGMENRVTGSFPFSDFWKWDVPNRSFRTKPATERSEEHTSELQSLMRI